MRCAIYARVSLSDGRQDEENQLLQLRQFAADHKWDIAGEYVDRASGKSTAKRDEFKRLFAEVSNFDCVLVWALDRFTREGIYSALGYVNELAKHGVKFYSYSEPQFSASSPCWDLMLSISAWVAQKERERISERTKAGLARRKGFDLWQHKDEIKALESQYTVREAAEIIQAKYNLKQNPHGTIYRIWKA